METKRYLLTDEKVKFCLKQLKSFKTSRWLSPLLLLPVNYVFLLALFGINNRDRILLGYIILCLFTTLGFLFLRSAAIKRYRNVITEIKIAENGNIEFNTLTTIAILIKSGNYRVTNDLLCLDRNNKFKVYVILFGGQNFSLIPEWFNDQKDLDLFFRGRNL